MFRVRLPAVEGLLICVRLAHLTVAQMVLMQNCFQDVVEVIQILVIRP